MSTSHEQKLLRPTAVFIIGPPGSGKGTQSHMLAEHLGFSYRSVSNRIREAFEQGEGSEELRRRYREGDLLPGDWIADRVIAALEETAHTGEGVIVDGALRDEVQTRRIVPATRHIYGDNNVAVVLLDVPDDDLRERLSARLVCSVCQMPLLPGEASEGDPCPDVSCGGVVERRVDDASIDVINHRLSRYHSSMEDVISYLKEQNMLYIVDGTLPPVEVAAAVLEAIGL